MKKKILITAYAANPYKGSEDGIGWNIIRHLAAKNKVIAITRENNGGPIHSYLKEHPMVDGEQLQFEYFDLPYWMRFWKKGARGSSLYHILWHFGVVFFIWKKRLRFDIAHHLNFNADWSPSFLYLLGKPFVWGPIGHHHKIPRSYILPHGRKAWLKDRLVWWVKCYFWKFDPFLKLTKWSADKIIGLNSSVFEVMRVPKHKQLVLPAAGNEMPSMEKITNDKFQVLSIGRFVPLKGFDISIHAFADCYRRQPIGQQQRLQLILIGKGPEKQNLLNIANQYQLPKTAIRFVDWLSREELTRFYASCKTFIFPSHEGAGMVVPEALSHGLPVICFDNYGPGELVDDSCALKVPYSTYEQSIDGFSNAIERLLLDNNLQMDLSKHAKKRFRNHFTWAQKAERIGEIYDEIMAGAPALVAQPLGCPGHRPSGR